MAVLKLWRELFLFIRFDANRNTYTGVCAVVGSFNPNPLTIPDLIPLFGGMDEHRLSVNQQCKREPFYPL